MKKISILNGIDSRRGLREVVFPGHRVDTSNGIHVERRAEKCFRRRGGAVPDILAVEEDSEREQERECESEEGAVLGSGLVFHSVV